MALKQVCMRVCAALAKLLAAGVGAFLLFILIPVLQEVFHGEKETDSTRDDLQNTTVVIQKKQSQPEPRRERRPKESMREVSASVSRSSSSKRLDFTPDLGVGDGAGAAVAGGGAVATAVFDEGDTDTPPVPVSRSAVPYPPLARKHEIEGTVVVTFVVSRQGNVENISFEQLPHRVFREPVRTTLRSWRFTPGEKEGVKVAVRVRQKLNFRLE
ncbi:MAG: energy transducer TonB [Fibrobacterota bacterium]